MEPVVLLSTEIKVCEGIDDTENRPGDSNVTLTVVILKEKVLSIYLLQ